MPDFSITDDLGKPVDSVKVDWTSASSLFQYLKSQALHLIVVPDFLARVDQPLTQAAPGPIRFQVKVGNRFQLGDTRPEIDITPSASLTLRANTRQGRNLFDDEPFRLTATVPEDTGYVGLSLTGALDLGLSGSAGELSFGFDDSHSVTLEYLKAFPTAANEPTFGEATGRMLSTYVIPGSLASFDRLGVNDICTVSGTGSLTVSGSFAVATPANPLASVKLPLGVGVIQVQDGAMTGLSAALTISGSYQIRVRKLPTGAIELSYLREAGKTLRTDLSASAGVKVSFGGTDLLKTLMRAISKDEVDKNLLAGLKEEEAESFKGAIKEGIDHSLRASLDLALSAITDDTTAFQYEIRPDLLDEDSRTAVSRALAGDLTLLTALEEGMAADGTLAPGVKVLNSVLTRMRSTGVSMKVNLLGIINLISISNLISNCEFLTDPANGGLTVKETAQSERISAITNPLDRAEALRKAMFDSVMVTTTYRASQAVVLPELTCSQIHFAVNENTNAQIIGDYLNWFVALDLMDADEKPGVLSKFPGGGPSTCLMRTEFDGAACQALFFDGEGNPRLESDYLEIGRRALTALLDPAGGDIDRYRYRFLNDAGAWPQALDIGPSPQLGSLLPIPSTHPQYVTVLQDVTGDLYDIRWWAKGMRKAGECLQQVREFMAGREPVSLKDDAEFAKQREALQKVMLDVVSKSKVRFHEPWGMVCLYRAGGSRESFGRLAAGALQVERKRTAGAPPLAMPAHS